MLFARVMSGQEEAGSRASRALVVEPLDDLEIELETAQGTGSAGSMP
jgi:hypothetical protein